MSGHTINGITFSNVSSENLDQKPVSLPGNTTPPMPLVSINEVGESHTSYEVHIMVYIPSVLTPIGTLPPNAFYLPKEDGTDNLDLCFAYPSDSKIPIRAGGDELSCREFCVEYDHDDHVDIVAYNRYLIRFTYALDSGTAFQDAIAVYDNNLDPETSRGTVTTVRY